MTQQQVRLRVCSLAVALFVSTSASATPVFFDTRAAFDAAVGAHGVITFDDVPEGPVEGCTIAFISDRCELTLGEATFVATLPLFVPQAPGGAQGPLLSVFPFGASNKLISNAGAFDPDDFFVNFSGTAFGVDLFGAVEDELRLFEVWIDEIDGTRSVVSVRASLFDPAFIGAVSPNGFSRAAFLNVPEDGLFSNLLIDNVAIQPVPEPSVALLYGIGLVAVSARRVFSRR